MFTAIILIVIISLFAYKLRTRPCNYPPGPFCLPIVGYLPFLGSHIYQQLWELSKKYGDVFSIHLGLHRVVVLTSFKAIHDVFKENKFSGRPSFHSFLSLREARMGIVSGEGKRWSELRRFTLSTLKDLGLGKSKFEGFIVNEIQELIDSLVKDVGKPIYLDNRLNLAVVNSLWASITGERLPLDDPEAQNVMNAIAEISMLWKPGDASTFITILRYFGDWKRRCMERVSRKQSIVRFVQAFIKKHQIKTTTHEKDDLIHQFMNKLNDEEDFTSPFCAKYATETLTTTLIDLLVAGSETTSTTLRWLFLLLTLHPKVQDKIQEEIDHVMSDEQYPSIAHKFRMPYTEAVLMEVTRFKCVIPLGVTHLSLEDTEFRGYTISKGTLFTANLYAVMRDPRYWERPNEFYPEHFLNPDGTLRHRQALIPFSTGKRVCLGESLARTELFLFSTHLLKKFKFCLPEDQMNPSSEPVHRLILNPQPYEIVLRCRT